MRTVDLQFYRDVLPTDIDQNGNSQRLDLLRFRQYISIELPGGVCGSCPHNTIGGLAEDYFDTDRSGVINPIDLLRYRKLIFGVGNATRAWAGAVLPPRP